MTWIAIGLSRAVLRWTIKISNDAGGRILKEKSMILESSTSTRLFSSIQTNSRPVCPWSHMLELHLISYCESRSMPASQQQYHGNRALSSLMFLDFEKGWFFSVLKSLYSPGPLLSCKHKLCRHCVKHKLGGGISGMSCTNTVYETRSEDVRAKWQDRYLNVRGARTWLVTLVWTNMLYR